MFPVGLVSDLRASGSLDLDVVPSLILFLVRRSLGDPVVARVASAAGGSRAALGCANAVRGYQEHSYWATSGMIGCLPGAILCRVPCIVCRILSGQDCLVRLSLKLSSPLIFLTAMRPRATWS